MNGAPLHALEYAAFGSAYSSLLTLQHSDAPHLLERSAAWSALRLCTSRHHLEHHKKCTKNFGHIFTIWDDAINMLTNGA